MQGDSLSTRLAPSTKDMAVKEARLDPSDAADDRSGSDVFALERRAYDLLERLHEPCR